MILGIATAFVLTFALAYTYQTVNAAPPETFISGIEGFVDLKCKKIFGPILKPINFTLAQLNEAGDAEEIPGTFLECEDDNLEFIFFDEIIDPPIEVRDLKILIGCDNGEGVSKLLQKNTKFNKKEGIITGSTSCHLPGGSSGKVFTSMTPVIVGP